MAQRARLHQARRVSSEPHDQYFAAEPASPGERRQLLVRLGSRDVTVETAAGVFSAGRLDPGTAVLLRGMPRPPEHGTLLDLGCGWGPLALALALRSPAAEVVAVDVNARARELTSANAERLGLPRVRVAAPEEVPASLGFDGIWSNPPVRIGKAALHALLLHWLPRLVPGGTAWLVTQRNLGADSLQRWLDDALPAGFATAREGSSKGYRVLRVTRSVSPSSQ